jgi:hypothetical protein
MCPHLTVDQRRLALRLEARGLSLREIGPDAAQLRTDLERLVFLLGGSDGEPLFGPQRRQSLSPRARCVPERSAR